MFSMQEYNRFLEVQVEETTIIFELIFLIWNSSRQGQFLCNYCVQLLKSREMAYAKKIRLKRSPKSNIQHLFWDKHFASPFAQSLARCLFYKIRTIQREILISKTSKWTAFEGNHFNVHTNTSILDTKLHCSYLFPLYNSN